LELGIAECTTKESEMLSDWRCMRKVARRAVEQELHASCKPFLAAIA
jgi:hypothetical protein